VVFKSFINRSLKQKRQISMLLVIPDPVIPVSRTS
jgi:hypothetical protein